LERANDRANGSRFPHALDPIQRRAALLPFASDERRRHQVPKRRRGMALKAMNDARRPAAKALLRAAAADAAIRIVSQEVGRSADIALSGGVGRYRQAARAGGSGRSRRRGLIPTLRLDHVAGQ
jgi:hypothetical protein